MKTFKKERITFSVPDKKINTSIYFGKALFDEIASIVPLDKYSSLLVILDRNVSYHWSKRIRKVLGKGATYLIIPSGEKNKTLSAVEKIWATLSQKGFDRKSLIINIGGGLICDIGAFAASTYMRGIDFLQIPTTLLAQADASMGGKTGFNFNGLKNTIGTFSMPIAVLTDASFLSTLSKREFTSGFAEIIKHAIIADRNMFDLLLNKRTTALSEKELDTVLALSATIKCKIVCKDPFEKKERKKLNFGHTVGHALEMSCENKLLHGEAVAIGMIAEARMSFLSGSISENKFKTIESLINNTRLTNKINKSYKDAILKKMLSDKKNERRQIRWVLLEDIGKTKVDVALPDKIVNEGLDYILK